MAFDHKKSDIAEAVGIDEESLAEINAIIKEAHKKNKVSEKIETVLSEGFNYVEVAYACYVLGAYKKKGISDEDMAAAPQEIVDLLKRLKGEGASGISFGPFPIGHPSPLSALFDAMQGKINDGDDSDTDEGSEDDTNPDDNTPEEK